MNEGEQYIHSCGFRCELGFFNVRKYPDTSVVEEKVAYDGLRLEKASLAYLNSASGASASSTRQ